jgi:hypothetical protein
MYHPNHLPDIAFTIQEDSEALAFLRALNIADRIPDPRTLSMTAVTGIYDSHSTHWITFVRCEGYAQPHDNGHAVLCFPKSKVRREVAESAIRETFLHLGSDTDSSAPFLRL